jgi:hypothetical protein
VVVSSQLKTAEPMAWDFVMNFAKDNDLQVVEACSLPQTTLVPRRALEFKTDTKKPLIERLFAFCFADSAPGQTAV